MESNYECPRCHNIFPSSNKIMHDAHCTEEKPLPLDASRKKALNEEENQENKENKEEKDSGNLLKSQPSGEFPDVFECDICHQMFMEKERKDHMFCHNLEKEEKKKENNYEASPQEIARQKEIERQIEINKRNNQSNEQRNNQRINNPFFSNSDNDDFGLGDPNSNLGFNFLNNLRSAINNQQNSGMNEIERNQRNNNPVRNNINTNNIIRLETIGPNGERIVRTIQNNQPEINIFGNNSGRRRNISFLDLNSGSFDDIFSEFLRRMGSYEHPTEEQILNELPETQIEDVNKLDPEKKNCIICLEDFKNGDKAIILPCIHLFHTECIKTWLKSQDTCPICKFKLTGDNMNQTGNI